MLTIHQELALKHPYTLERAEERERVGVEGRHRCQRWLGTDVQVDLIFTIDIPGGEHRPFWHVSVGVLVRDTGVMFMDGVNKKTRRRLRDLAQEMIKGVGYPPDGDSFDIGERSLHVMRDLTDEEIKFMKKVRRDG